MCVYVCEKKRRKNSFSKPKYALDVPQDFYLVDIRMRTSAHTVEGGCPFSFFFALPSLSTLHSRSS